MGGIISTIKQTAKPTTDAETTEEPAVEVTHSKVVLNDLNDDCLLEICEYLSLQDVRNLGATCHSLWEYTNATVIPKAVKKLELIVLREKKTVLHWNSCVATVDGLRSQVMKFGNFVEHISINALHSDITIWPTFGVILKLCPNLKTLRIENASCNIFRPREENPRENFSELLSNISPHLKEFHWINSEKLTNECSIVIKRMSELEKLTVRGGPNVIMLFEHCKHLTYLDIEYYSMKRLPSAEAVDGKINSLKTIFENNGQTLRTLKLKCFDYLKLASISQLIAEKLPRLERLEISDEISVLKPNYGYIELRQVNILKLAVRKGNNITSLMTALSNFGVIEELSICGDFCNSRTGLLTFEKLRNIDLYQPRKNTAFMKIIARADMPQLEHLTINIDYCKNEADYFNEILEVVQSKKSLSSLRIKGFSDLSSLVIKLIEMLKADFSGDRPLLRLFIQREIGDEEMEILTANKHLLSVNNIRMEECKRETSNHKMIYLFPHYDPTEVKIIKSHPNLIWAPMCNWGDDTFQDNDYIISFLQLQPNKKIEYDDSE